MAQLNFIFGIGIFLFGMSQLEYGIRKLGDARLRYWLRSSTGSRLGSVSTGIVTTAILQSSSMVSLLVLAFASAGVLPLVNAVGIQDAYPYFNEYTQYLNGEITEASDQALKWYNYPADSSLIINLDR